MYFLALLWFLSLGLQRLSNSLTKCSPVHGPFHVGFSAFDMRDQLGKVRRHHWKERREIS